jgi:Na+-transporting NADH:ubiquinone oxidoreductase subunit D
MPPQTPVTARKAFWTQVWGENPIFRQVLGICSALAVTNLMFQTLLMCVGLIWATSLSALTASLLRHYTPPRVRMILSVLIISVYVIIVDIAMRVYFPGVHRQIAAYVGLIITNCIILGRMEVFATKNPPWVALADGLGAGLGYSFMLMAVAFVREVLGFGTVFGVALPAREVWWHSWTIMVMPPGAFFVLGLMTWAARSYALKREAPAAGEGGR